MKRCVVLTALLVLMLVAVAPGPGSAEVKPYDPAAVAAAQAAGESIVVAVNATW